MCSQISSLAEGSVLDDGSRMIVVSWMVEVAEEYGLQQETLHAAVHLLDRFLSTSNVSVCRQLEERRARWDKQGAHKQPHTDLFLHCAPPSLSHPALFLSSSSSGGQAGRQAGRHTSVKAAAH